ncbi:ubiquinone biosynthesis hydrox [Hesseltinella vesiculosa]|uniref:Ubiquinone biosynthesis monooxygenase COQ6, mitochondrial n=1 Tax=Hesseltinella vesiculosa TaxID=101127 RepID=A0A1X2GXG4_9FUNG|nr:ubiquinone biosynthesis hydrox [Hesseltinella vesiculosa]
MLTQLSKALLRQTRAHGARRFYATQNLDNVYDIVIVGGGVAGTALACSLASQPYLKQQRIALIEAMDLSNTLTWTAQPDDFSNRTVSLTPGSMRFLQDIGATDFFTPGRANPYSDMRVWDGVTDAHIHFDASMADTTQQKDESNIAYMIENVHLQHALLKRLEQCQEQGAALDLFTKTRVASIEQTQPSGDTNIDALDLSDWPMVHLEQGPSLRARLLIGADGIQSPVRSFANIDSLGWDYNAHGVVATLKLDSPEHHTAWQRFLPTGPIAMLPMGEGYASMVWSTKPHLAKLLKTISADDFVQLVNAAFRLNHVDLSYFYKELGQGQLPDLAGEVAWRDQVMRNDQKRLPPKVAAVQEGSRASFPLRLRNSERYVSDRVALVGDAAHTTHPLAGQGLNQGLLDVEYLTYVLAEGAREGQDLGSIHLLRNYATERYLKNIVMISACDKLHRLFSTDFPPVTWLRSLGLSTVNNLDAVKGEIMRYAMAIEQPMASKPSSS